jgi:PKD repeat protein
MKKYSLVVSYCFLHFIMQASSVSQQVAQTVAINFYKVTVNNQAPITATLQYTRTEADSTVDFYVFDISPVKGFVIVSGNSSIVPVIGYSGETNFRLDNTLSTGISCWMNHVASRIHKTVSLDIQADNRISGLWSAYLAGVNPYPLRSGGVNPLLTTTWDQEPNYNQLCPYNSTNGQRTVTGCVATAMAQIMKFWGYPKRGRGSYTYVDSMPAFSNNYGRLSANFDTLFDWANMPASINSSCSPVALLMYDCGVSVGMDYGDDNEGGSGAWVLQSEAGAGAPCSQYAYVNYFYYNPNTIQGIIKSHYTQSTFITLIENELNSNRVVQYEGDDTNGAGGHTWVCDGYDAGNNLHMNWGWSGQNDGYFAIGNLDAGQYNFDDNEAALIGIEPISPINVTAGVANESICPGTSTTLTAHGPALATFSWTPTTGLTCPTCASTLVNTGTDAIYTVTADSAGVKGYATIAVNIVQPVTAGFSANTIADCAAPAGIPFNNLSANGSNYFWDFGDGTSDTATNPIHSYTNYGTYNVKLIAFNSCGTDSVLHNNAVQITDRAPVVQGLSICSGNSATLSATGAGQIQWYDAPAGGNLVNTGNSYVTPALVSTTTYYVNSVIAPPSNTVGPVDNSTGSGGYFTNTNEHGIFFNCTIAQVLNSVDVYAQNAGDRIISLKDSAGNLLNSITVNIPAGHSTVTLNLLIPAENGLKLALSGNDGLYRNNSGAVYPYNSSDGSVVITGSDAGTPGYYYFFYNWKLQQPGCTTTTTIVPVTVVGGLNNQINETANGLNVNFQAGAGITSCTWQFGDESTSSQLNASHSYASYGNYTVVLIETNGQCTDTVTQIISLYPTSIQDAGSIEFLSIFPDPAHNELQIKITSNVDGLDWNLVTYNILGQKELRRNVQLQQGVNSFILDVSSLDAAVHILSFQNGGTVINRRFVKTN